MGDLLTRANRGGGHSTLLTVYRSDNHHHHRRRRASQTNEIHGDADQTQNCRRGLAGYLREPYHNVIIIVRSRFNLALPLRQC